MRYVPYGQLAGQPHVVLDGSATAGTALVLSHWPGSPTPRELAADLSTEIAFRYVERPVQGYLLTNYVYKTPKPPVTETAVQAPVA